jgi:leucyl aminopeptidase
MLARGCKPPGDLIVLAYFTTDAGDSVPLTPLTRDELPGFLVGATEAERTWLKAIAFTAEPGKTAFLPRPDGSLSSVLVGVDRDDTLWSLASLPEALPEGRYRLAADWDGAATTKAALGWALGTYGFDRYKSRKRGPATLVWPERADRGEVERLARGIFLARDLINTPAEDMGPGDLAAAARTLAEANGASCTVVEGDALLAANYPTIHAVGRASSRPPCLIDLRWGDAKAPKVTLVGKGVVFDTGGLDIKGAGNMRLMKKDMGGGAIMMGLAAALMDANLPIRLRLLVPAVENAISANAIRPLDIVRTRSGKTVEIGNTDAEGRLILCDALTEAVSETPALILDCATLTGAARVALGPDIPALFSNDDALADGLLRAGTAQGDPLWRLPLWQGYRKLIDSKVADLNNVSESPFAGAIVAALYLAEFVAGTTPWGHLDVMAWNGSARPGRPEGGEAIGLRALYDYISRRFA